MKQSGKKTRLRQAKKQNDTVLKDKKMCNNGESEEKRIIDGLVEAFSLASIDEAVAAYREANGDPNKAAEILTESSDNSSDAYQASCSSSSSGSNRTSSENLSLSDGFTDSSSVVGDGDGDGDGGEFRGTGGKKGRKVVAACGTVSNLIGKDYVAVKSRKAVFKEKGFGGGKVVNVEEAEQFLCSMLGDDCELSMAVVRDVLCNCGYDIEKALEVLLDLSSPPSEPSASDEHSDFSLNSNRCSRNGDFSDNFWELTDRGSDSSSYSSESDIQDSMQFFNYTGRNYADALLSSESSRKLAKKRSRTDKAELPQQLLESLFNMPKCAEHDPSTMNWRNVVKQMESFAHKRVELGTSDSLPQQMIAQAVAKGTEYQVFRGTAQQRWDEMNSCYHKAATAFSNGEKNYAAYMSEKGKLYSKKAREADEKASMEIFKARNKGIENSLTIDLHGQHVKQAMKVLKLHLLFSTYISSVQFLRVITGCGSQGLGKSMVKESVMDLLEKERVAWKEENQGTVLIKLDGPREFSFLDSGSDSESS
ncbi:SMR domain-containing protein At5g58720-like [Silene latifolia]|uniref:SMR domain-containing protein At5g58720-like n=1 Tax=Silene latifolia TaxID=37657 RepID=UPI003D7742E4